MYDDIDNFIRFLFGLKLDYRRKADNFTHINCFLFSPKKYVNELTSKYLPPNQSPWQVHVISCNQSNHSRERRFFLVRVHHQLLTEEKLSMGDFLPLGHSNESWDSSWDMNSPFAHLYDESSVLPKLHQKLTESFSNIWNDFVSRNDPLERPEILKERVSICQCFKIIVIVAFSSMKEITR